MRRCIRPKQGTIPTPKSCVMLLVAQSTLSCLPWHPGAVSPPHPHAHHMHHTASQAQTEDMHLHLGLQATPRAVYVLPKPSKGQMKRSCLFSLACPSIRELLTLCQESIRDRVRYRHLLPWNQTGEGEEQTGEERGGEDVRTGSPLIYHHRSQPQCSLEPWVFKPCKLEVVKNPSNS